MAEKELRGYTKNGNISKSDKGKGSCEEIWSATSERREAHVQLLFISGNELGY